MKRMFLPALLFTSLAWAQTPEERGLQLAVESDARDHGFGDTRSELTMILRNRHGDESVRTMRSMIFEKQDDGDKSLIIFDKPADVKGTALLSFAHKEGDDDQWLYLPALKRVKRISSGNKSGPFMGSEFAYEDVSPIEVEKYAYTYLGDEVYEGMNCHMVERRPTYTKSGYTRSIVWFDQEELRPHKITFYDRKDEHQKTLTISEYKQYLDKFWRAGRMEMINHQTGKSTVLNWGEFEFQTGLQESDFTQNRLKTLR